MIIQSTEATIILDELDQELQNRGLECCQFADGCNILVKSQKAAEFWFPQSSWESSLDLSCIPTLERGNKS